MNVCDFTKIITATCLGCFTSIVYAAVCNSVIVNDSKQAWQVSVGLRSGGFEFTDNSACHLNKPCQIPAKTSLNIRYLSGWQSAWVTSGRIKLIDNNNQAKEFKYSNLQLNQHIGGTCPYIQTAESTGVVFVNEPQGKGSIKIGKEQW